jgi:putative FmdB family regulatory protein
MPIYEYRCSACGHHLEALQKMSDAPLRKCPDCGKSQLRRLVSAPQFRLKGSGWYETDFKGDKEKKRNLVEKAEAAEPVKSEEKKEAAAATAAPDKPKSTDDKAKPKAAKPSTTRKPTPKSRAAKSAKA